MKGKEISPMGREEVEKASREEGTPRKMTSSNRRRQLLISRLKGRKDRKRHLKVN
jgi:hypothetical protein